MKLLTRSESDQRCQDCSRQVRHVHVIPSVGILVTGQPDQPPNGQLRQMLRARSNHYKWGYPYRLRECERDEGAEQGGRSGQ